MQAVVHCPLGKAKTRGEKRNARFRLGHDPCSPDTGAFSLHHPPIRSVVWRIGRLVPDAEGDSVLRPYEHPQRLATLDGLKVESLAVRRDPSGAQQLFVGTDDENYGGALRLLPISLDNAVTSASGKPRVLAGPKRG